MIEVAEFQKALGLAMAFTQLIPGGMDASRSACWEPNHRKRLARS